MRSELHKISGAARLFGATMGCMKRTSDKKSYKLGADRNEAAVKARTKDANFKQSRDVHEDRGERQAKMGACVRTVR
jgi:hypothetical protein